MKNIDKDEIIKKLIDALEDSINELHFVDHISEYNALNDKYGEFIEECRKLVNYID